MAFILPKGMRLGVAAAATQIDGGNRENSWYDWFTKGHIKDGANPSVACKHYELYVQDARLMQELGIKDYRMGIEWARLEPERGVFDQEAFAHYRREIELLHELGIEVLLTLHHFTNPMWFERMGSFEHPECMDIFLAFVRKVIEELGGLVSEYITINEPNVYAASGFFLGEWPPGKKSMDTAFLVMRNMCACHIKAYGLIHKLRKEKGYGGTRVSYAHHMRSYTPKKWWNPWHIICTPVLHRFFQSCISREFLTGKPVWPMGRVAGVSKGLYCDFHAINYYSRTAVTGLADGVLESVSVNDLGWEIYPPGIAKNTRELYKLAKLPVYITENGTCDNSDGFRARYLYDHLKVLSESGLPVERYYHWCFTDNFEWLEGYSARFGLVHVDYSTQERTVKKSGIFYKKIIEAGGVTKEMEEEYCRSSYKTNR